MKAWTASIQHYSL